MAFHYLQYVLGLARLGHDVCYHEDTWSWPYHPVRNEPTEQGDYSAAFIADFFARYSPGSGAGSAPRWHYLHLHEQSFGMSRAAFDAFAREADLFLNVSGAGFIPDALSGDCCKVFVDTDPGYNQLVFEEQYDWTENAARWRQCVLDHDRHFTFGENIHGEDCRIPKVGLDWRTTRQPVVLDAWPTPAPREAAPWSTVMTWNAFKGPLTRGEVEYKSKGAEFEKIIDLPARLGRPLLTAVGGKDAPLDRVRDRGWTVVDAPGATRTVQDYVSFLAGSRGEISAAKNVYVALRSGWFSERTCSYLALGRPAVVQDTGFSRFLPTGEGLFAFDDGEQAAEAIERVEADYARHARAARNVAAECFDAAKVLPKLIEDAFAGAPEVAGP